MTVQHADRDAIRHGKITEEPLRERPGVPTWVLKLIMAVTGLIFFLFVIGHMVGNLKIFMPDHAGGAAIDEYGTFLREMGQPLFPGSSLLWIIRIVLLACLVLHVWGALALKARSSKSRGKFRRTNLMGGLQSTAARWMIVTGIILLLFIIFHILDLTVGEVVASEAFTHGAVKNNLLATFAPERWFVTLFYVIAMIALFLHLTHGVYLAVSDLGWLGKRGSAIMVVLAYWIPAIVVIGNIVMPLAIAFGMVS
ncbi:succinate dehydrogenase cytochrome b subunit [Corynebacterium sp. p3-SID1194]|uniref:succinate dehydrogenase cytochrome b subunit n=1 Tax=Corynebacterium sp. p3-SID1194 TaxID=2916105 RepID=UPI0021A8DCB7|nr:succinate dehydrogenase cytochrome b subunit [Corynebacterium sp. p3-SID1194]MCT1449661.1 succinate dehydrogenase cytochrome b subunit [Corynebacterium sp. p3-SID1194]